MPDERAFAALSASTATISTHLAYLASVADWLARQGVRSEVADGYVRSIFAGVGRGLAEGTTPLTALVAAHETPTGINEQLRRACFDESAHDTLHEALDDVRTRLMAPSR